MCDLLTISSRHPCRVGYLLPAFAICGKRNRHGWGVGYFGSDGGAMIHTSSREAYDESRAVVDEELVRLSTEARSRYFLCHVRLASCGEVCSNNNHPFMLQFLGYDWLFAHNGTCRGLVDYQSVNDRVPDATNDSARIFEYLRDRLLSHCKPAAQDGVPLFRAVAAAVRDLINAYNCEDPLNDNFNFLLCNGSALFVFMHYRPFFVRCQHKAEGDALVMTCLLYTSPSPRD